jgi:hypothetical protein
MVTLAPHYLACWTLNPTQEELLQIFNREPGVTICLLCVNGAITHLGLGKVKCFMQDLLVPHTAILGAVRRRRNPRNELHHFHNEHIPIHKTLVA